MQSLLWRQALTYFRRRKMLAGRKGKAGEGNRTLVSSLGSWRSTIELHPHSVADFGLHPSPWQDRFSQMHTLTGDSAPFLHLLGEGAVCAVGIILEAKIFVDLEQSLLVRDRL